MMKRQTLEEKLQCPIYNAIYNDRRGSPCRDLLKEKDFLNKNDDHHCTQPLG